MGWEFEMVAGPFNPRLTEGPAWDGKALLFTHIPASRIYRYDPATGECDSSALNRAHEHQRAMRRWNARVGRPRCFGGAQRGSGT
jgi:sugar lactone lactonase YvrE